MPQLFRPAAKAVLPWSVRHFLRHPWEVTWEGLQPLRRSFGPYLGVLHQYPPRRWRPPAPFRGSLPSPPPVISVVTPSYNQARFLPRTVESVLGQCYPRLEYIVQDGGSTDGTPALLERYRARLAHCESRRDNGQADALNRGFRRATGEVLAYLNSDDLLLPGALACVADYFRRHPEVDVLYGHRIIIDPEDHEVGRWVLPPHDDDVLSWSDLVPQETLFWRRGIWEAVGGRVDESFRFALDWDLLLRFRAAGARFARVPRFLGAFRVHPAQKTSAWMDGIGRMEIDRLRRRCHGRGVTEEEVTRQVRPYLRRHMAHHLLYRAGVLL
jgi:glycosyltransferase involved in cell wall biosynthesis